jgi:serine/threonine protein phosphatase PrpC
MAGAASVDLKVSVLSRTGGRQRNEDACGFWSADGRGCYVLADGAGGHGGGDVASRVAVETVLSAFASEPDVSPRSVQQAIARANEAILSRQRIDTSVGDMRSTLVVLQIDLNHRRAIWGHLGDSRLYVFRQGRVVGCTRDHSLLEDVIAAGVIAPDSGKALPDRNVLTGSLGSADTFFPAVPATSLPLRDGDAFLLCSDGFWDHLDPPSMERALQRTALPDSWLLEMEGALTPRLQAGSDNYSAIAVWCGDQDFATIPSAPVARKLSDSGVQS